MGTFSSVCQGYLASWVLSALFVRVHSCFTVGEFMEMNIASIMLFI